ncbi:MAG: SDR family NAD(P)-dependent oxidoreductase [Spirochaetaceae bacterium]|nr:MAG: SDR family NAD(P)-dependent oxidoreductase [Spirochaetaceae bacterium]
MSDYSTYSVVLTGASRGLGEAAARLLIEGGVGHLFCISRSVNDDIVTLAQKRGVDLRWTQCDLSDAPAATDVARAVCEACVTEAAGTAVLVNNAALLEPVARVGHLNPHDLISLHTVNTIAPSLFADAFLAAVASRTGEIAARVINVSSGLGARAMAGVGMYCMSKAAVDMLTKVIHTEQEDRTNPTWVCSVSPGTVESHMQETLRAADEAHLRDRETFRELKRSGTLNTPEFSASKILSLLTRTDIDSGSILRVDSL